MTQFGVLAATWSWAQRRAQRRCRVDSTRMNVLLVTLPVSDGQVPKHTFQTAPAATWADRKHRLTLLHWRPSAARCGKPTAPCRKRRPSSVSRRIGAPSTARGEDSGSSRPMDGILFHYRASTRGVHSKRNRGSGVASSWLGSRRYLSASSIGRRTCQGLDEPQVSAHHQHPSGAHGGAGFRGRQPEPFSPIPFPNLPDRANDYCGQERLRMDGRGTAAGWGSLSCPTREPHLALDERTLFFESSRPGGQGAWTLDVDREPVAGVRGQLGPAVNTAGIEGSPFSLDGTSFL